MRVCLSSVIRSTRTARPKFLRCPKLPRRRAGQCGVRSGGVLPTTGTGIKSSTRSANSSASAARKSSPAAVNSMAASVSLLEAVSSISARVKGASPHQA